MGRDGDRRRRGARDRAPIGTPSHEQHRERKHCRSPNRHVAASWLRLAAEGILVRRAGSLSCRRDRRVWVARVVPSSCGCAGSARPILSRRATAPGSVGRRRRGPACPRRAELRAHLQRRLHGLATWRRSTAPTPSTGRSSTRPRLAFGDAAAAGPFHRAIDILVNDATGRHPVFAIEGGRVREATLDLGDHPAQGTSSLRKHQHRPLPLLARRAERRGRGEGRGGAGDRPDVSRVGGTCTSRSWRRRAGSASSSTRFGPAGSSPR